MTADGDENRLGRFVRNAARSAGRQVEEARRAYRTAREASDLPTDGDRVRIVCRRYAERRAVELDDRSRPACFDPDHPDCRGCAEDVREGCIETW